MSFVQVFFDNASQRPIIVCGQPRPQGLLSYWDGDEKLFCGVCRAVESQLGPWSDLSRRAIGGLGAQPPRKFFTTTPFSLPENEGNAPFCD